MRKRTKKEDKIIDREILGYIGRHLDGTGKGPILEDMLVLAPLILEDHIRNRSEDYLRERFQERLDVMFNDQG